MFKKILLSLLLLTALLNATAPTQENVAKLYVAMFDRAPDSAGLDWWINDSGLDLEGIAQSFFEQEETQLKYPPGTTAEVFVTAVYTNLFNRPPDAAGLLYWVKELESGKIPRSLFVLAVINGAQGTDATILENKTEVGLYFASKGLSNAEDAKYVLKDVTAEEATVVAAKEKIDILAKKSGCIEPPSGLMAWWPLDENSSPAQDIIGGNNGAWMGNPTPEQSHVDGFLSFDSASDYINVPNNSTLNVGTGDFSIDAWVKKTSGLNGVHTIVDKRSTQQGYSLYLYNGKLGLQLSDGNGYDNYNSDLYISDSGWNFVAVTVDRDNPNGLVFYVNGNQQTMDPTDHPGSLDNNHALLIGGNCVSGSNYFFNKGSIDEVELFNRALLPTEINSIYGAGTAGKCKDCMISYWKMEKATVGATAISIDYHDGNDGNLSVGEGTSLPIWTQSIVGQATAFEGGNSVRIPDSPNLNFSMGAFALEAWINYEGSTDGSVKYPAIMSKRPETTIDPDGGFFLGLSYWSGSNPGSLILRMDDTNYVPGTASIDDADWHHVVVQRCADNQVQFWIDGQLDSSTTSNKNISSAGASLRFGNDSSSSFETGWEGKLDEIAVYNCCLTGAKIQEHYQNGLNGEDYSY